MKGIAKAILRRNGEAGALSSLSSRERDLIDRVRGRNLTYLTPRRLASLVDTCNAIEDQCIERIFLEAGCALGGSAIVIAQAKHESRTFQIYDVFGMIPPPTKEDSQDVHDRYRTIIEGKSEGIGGEQYYGYVANLYEVVQDNLQEFGCDCSKQSITLVKGLVQDTMQLDRPVAFAHVDVDWYEPVRTCPQRIWPCLSIRGCIILDDYHY